MSDFTYKEKSILFDVADAAIRFGLAEHQQMQVQITMYPEKLREFGASFVTLEIAGNLRGCIGTLVAFEPLVQNVAKNAYAAAFCDPRFPALTQREYPKLKKRISVLSKHELMCFCSERDLLRQLRPGIDGLILSEHGCCGTFLPEVWQSLSVPEDFLRHLKLKAGLPMDYWSDTIKIERYTTEVIE